MLKLIMRIPVARRNPQPLPPPSPPTTPSHGEASRPEYVTRLRDDTPWSAADSVAAEPSQYPARCIREKQQDTCNYDFNDTDRRVCTLLGAEFCNRNYKRIVMGETAKQNSMKIAIYTKNTHSLSKPRYNLVQPAAG
jgi:hypothetical protein